MGYRKLPIEVRLGMYKEIDPETGCWLWTGACNKDGYGVTYYQGKVILAARLSLHLYKNFDLNGKLEACHETFCKNKNCFNPEHLRPDTHLANVKDSIEAGTHNYWSNPK